MDVDLYGGRAIPARLDRLPMTWRMWRILLLAGIAWLVESRNSGLAGDVLLSLERASAVPIGPAPDLAPSSAPESKAG